MASKKRRRLSQAPNLRNWAVHEHREVYGCGHINTWLTVADWTVIETATHLIAYKEGQPRAQVAVCKVGDKATDRRQLGTMLQHCEDHVLRTWVEVGGDDSDDR